jgi:peptidyl-prolyl cis-trans isomerase D
MRAELTLARLDKGERFADLAGELSDDQVSKADGGKLGLISRGDVAANLEEVAFALEPGTPSEIVEGQDGLHIIQIDEKVPASVLDFAEAGLTLAAEGAAKEVASRLATELSEAVAGGQSLEDAARGAGFTLERTSFFTRRRDGFVPGLRLPSLEIVATAFTLTSEAPSSKQVFEVGNRHVLIQLLDRQEPEPEALEAMVESAKQSLEAQQQNTLLQAWVDNRREEFESQQRLQINSALIADR